MDNELTPIDDRRGLLQDDEIDDYTFHQPLDHIVRRMSRFQRWHLTALYIMIVCLLISLIWSLNHIHVHDPFMDVYSPANSAVEYEDVVFYDNIRNFSPYQMPPSDDVDSLWNELYLHESNQRIDAAAVKKLSNGTVTIPGTDGDGVVILEVFHLLHCLNMLRKGLWPERYPDDGLVQGGNRDDNHITHHLHCIDRLRQNVMCHSNTGALYYYWNTEKEHPHWMLDMHTTQKCRNFDLIHQWAKDHHFSQKDFESQVRWTPPPSTSSNP